MFEKKRKKLLGLIKRFFIWVNMILLAQNTLLQKVTTGDK